MLVDVCCWLMLLHIGVVCCCVFFVGLLGVVCCLVFVVCALLCGFCSLAFFAVGGRCCSALFDVVRCDGVVFVVRVVLFAVCCVVRVLFC